MAAGKLKHKLQFASRQSVTDDFGNEQGGYANNFVRWAEVRPIKGSEQMLAQRLTGVQPVLILVRMDSETRDIQPDWRATDLNEGTVYALHSIADMEQKRKRLTMTATAGVAV